MQSQNNCSIFSLDPDDQRQDGVNERFKNSSYNSNNAGDDFSAKFARQLKSKAAGTAAAAETFFFAEEDARLAESLDFFFGEASQLDLEAIRAEYQDRRPQLAAIFKKKARSKAKLSETRKKKTTVGKFGVDKRRRRRQRPFAGAHKGSDFKKKEKNKTKA